MKSRTLQISHTKTNKKHSYDKNKYRSSSQKIFTYHHGLMSYLTLTARFSYPYQVLERVWIPFQILPKGMKTLWFLVKGYDYPHGFLDLKPCTCTIVIFLLVLPCKIMFMYTVWEIYHTVVQIHKQAREL